MKIDKNNITAVILAGGRGQRLGGQDKGLVDNNGKPLIQTIIERIQPQVGEVVINANRNIDTYKKYASNVFSDEISDFQGPLSGISSAMKLVKTDYILTLPCDGPKLSLELVERMISKLSEAKDLTDNIAVAHDGKRIQPIHALIPVRLATSVEEFLSNGERKVKLWYEKHNIILVDFSDQPDSFFNINEKEQLFEGVSHD